MQGVDWDPTRNRIVIGAGDVIQLLDADDSAGEPETADSPFPVGGIPGGWVADGRHVFYEFLTVEDGAIVLVDLETGETETFLDSPANEYLPAASPDGRWVAYTSDASGVPEVYVRPFPSGTPEYVLSRGGGSDPRWSADGSDTT